MLRNPKVKRRIHGQAVTTFAIDAHRESGVAMRARQGHSLDPFINQLARSQAIRHGRMTSGVLHGPAFEARHPTRSRYYGATGQKDALVNQTQESSWVQWGLDKVSGAVDTAASAVETAVSTVTGTVDKATNVVVDTGMAAKNQALSSYYNVQNRPPDYVEQKKSWLEDIAAKMEQAGAVGLVLVAVGVVGTWWVLSRHGSH